MKDCFKNIIHLFKPCLLLMVGLCSWHITVLGQQDDQYLGIWDLHNDKIQATLFVPPFKGDSTKANIKMYGEYAGLRITCTLHKKENAISLKVDSLISEDIKKKFPSNFITELPGLYLFTDSFINNNYNAKYRFHLLEKITPKKDTIAWLKKLEKIEPGNAPKTDTVGTWLPEADRKQPVIKSITVYRKNIELELWDHNEQDGDTISIKLNDKWVLQEFPLKKEKYKFTIVLESKNNVLLMFAENLGSIPPNTASISVFDGIQKQYAKVNSDFTKSESLRIELYGGK